jgi:hypothetical protein
MADSETIGFSDLVYVVGCYETAGAGHIFHDNGGLSGNVLAHMTGDSAGIGVEPAASRKTDNDPNRLAFVKVIRRCRASCFETHQQGHG